MSMHNVEETECPDVPFGLLQQSNTDVLRTDNYFTSVPREIALDLKPHKLIKDLYISDACVFTVRDIYSRAALYLVKAELRKEILCKKVLLWEMSEACVTYHSGSRMLVKR